MPSCMDVKYVHVEVINDHASPAVTYNKHTNTVYINFKKRQASHSKYQIMATGKRIPRCNPWDNIWDGGGNNGKKPNRPDGQDNGHSGGGKKPQYTSKRPRPVPTDSPEHSGGGNEYHDNSGGGGVSPNPSEDGIDNHDSTQNGDSEDPTNNTEDEPHDHSSNHEEVKSSEEALPPNGNQPADPSAEVIVPPVDVPSPEPEHPSYSTNPTTETVTRRTRRTPKGPVDGQENFT